MDPLSIPTAERQSPEEPHDLEAVLIILQIALGGALIGLTGLGILLLRQDIVLHRLVKNQAPMAAAAAQETQKISGLVRQLQALGKRFPDYQSNVLSRFQLPPAPKSPGGN